MEWSLDGKLSTYLQPAGRANGMYFDASGNLIACADEKTELWSIAPDKTVTVLAKEYETKSLNGPNDVWVAPHGGGLYITDPFYKRDWWNYNAMPQPTEQVYYLAPGGKKLVRVTEDLNKPNGITGTPDGKKLFVADIGADRTYVYDIQPDGTLANKKLFCAKGSDGMTIDERGDIYLCGHGVTVFDPSGKQIEHIAVQENWTANVSFGGADHQTLFITASKSLYSIQLQVKGANPSK
jgi:gluconolactonase